ncbi:MAG TPA: FHA domain-containing protein [Caldimonas sp.]|nr:FHA domain-containing protein [Caldimonas sp.]
MGPLARIHGTPDEAAPGGPAANDTPIGGALLEAIDRDGMVRQAWRIERWPLSIGRALDNDAVLTDPHVAAHHATIELRPAAGAGEQATLVVRTGETKNGLSVGRDRVAAGETKTIVDTGHDLDLHVGRTALRLRLPGHALAPEQMLAPRVAVERRWLPTVVLALAVLAIVVFNAYLDTDPDGLARASEGAVLTAVSGGAIWCTFWALLSKLFARQSNFAWHVRVFVVASLVMLGFAAVPPLFAFAFSWPWVTDFSFVAVYATVAGAIYFHLLAVEPGRQRLMRAVTATGFIVGVALTLWFNVQRTGRPGEELYMNHLFPPRLRLAQPVKVDLFVDGLAPMQAILDKQAKDKSGADDDAAGRDSDDE